MIKNTFRLLRQTVDNLGKACKINALFPTYAIMYVENKSITLSVSVRNDTVRLSANQMAELFERDEKTIRKHINNVFSEGEAERENKQAKNAC